MMKENYDDAEMMDSAYDANDPIANSLLEERINGFGLAGMIVGIIAFFIWVPCFLFAGGAMGILQAILGSIALILGIVGLKRSKKRGMAIAAIILGGLSILVGIILVGVTLISTLYLLSEKGFDGVGDYLNTFWNFIDYELF